MRARQQPTRSPYPVFAYRRYDIPEAMPRFDLARVAAGRKPYDGPVLRSPGQADEVDLEGDGTPATVRPRLATPRSAAEDGDIDGGHGVPFSGARRDYLELLRRAPEESAAKSALYGAAMGAGNAAHSGSLGYTIGAAGGGALAGFINKKLYGEAKKEKGLERAGREVAVEDAGVKRQREDEVATDESNLRKAQTKYWEARPKLDLDKANEVSLGRRRTQLLGQIRTQSHYKRGENPTLDAQLDDAEVSVSDFDKASDSFTWHESGGQALLVNKKGETRAATLDGVPIVDASKKPDPTTGLTPVQAAQVKQHELDRVSREKIAAEYAKLQGQRNSLSASEFGLRQQQFKARYPGVGKAPLKLSELDAEQRAEDSRAQRLGAQPRDLRKQAVEQGYEIDEEN